MLLQLQAALEGLQPRQRLALGAMLAISLIGLIAVAMWSSRPSYAVLYNSLSAEDASSIVEELRTDKVPYRLGANGTSIEVPTATLYETRLNLAGKGVPSRSGVGFELFDRLGLPGTDFSNAVTLQRALQGELARTICSLNEVKSARVHLALPQDDLYTEPVPPSASVLLDLGSNSSLTDEQVKGIVWLVTSAVEKLHPEYVTVVDSMGRVLHGAQGAGQGLDDSALTSARQYSEALTIRLQTMLDAVFGPHRTIVRAQADLDLDDEETNEERIVPVTPNRTDAVVREQLTEETFAGGGQGTGASAGGSAGIPANITGGTSTPGAEGSGSYSNRAETKEYQFSKRSTRRQRKPGKVIRLSIAAVVDEEVAVAGISRVQEIIEAAAGINLTRGDSVVVRAMPLNTAELAAKEEKLADASQTSDTRRKAIDTLLRWMLPVAISVLLLSMLSRIAGELKRNHDTRDVMSEDDAGTQQWAQLAGEAGLNAEGQNETQARPLTEEDELLAELKRVAHEQPEVLADELRNLISGQDET